MAALSRPKFCLTLQALTLIWVAVKPSLAASRRHDESKNIIYITFYE
jgi:hypothetical protein